MARVVDSHLERVRRDCAETSAMAARDADVMREKCAELGQQARSLLAGSPSGDQFVRSLETASAQLAEARLRLGHAIEVIHGIDVTIEVPDDEGLR